MFVYAKMIGHGSGAVPSAVINVVKTTFFPAIPRLYQLGNIVDPHGNLERKLKRHQKF
jgi:hypothetical protein